MINKIQAQKTILEALQNSIVVTRYGMTLSAWAKGDKVRIYINTPKRQSAGYVEITEQQAIMIDVPGHSLTRNAVKDLLSALTLPTTEQAAIVSKAAQPVSDDSRSALAQEGEDVAAQDANEFEQAGREALQ